MNVRVGTHRAFPLSYIGWVVLNNRTSVKITHNQMFLKPINCPFSNFIITIQLRKSFKIPKKIRQCKRKNLMLKSQCRKHAQNCTCVYFCRPPNSGNQEKSRIAKCLAPPLPNLFVEFFYLANINIR